MRLPVRYSAMGERADRQSRYRHDLHHVPGHDPALVVVLFHRRWWIGEGAIGHGYLAVDFFFMLSGFVIGYAYEDRLRRGDLTLGRFVRLRADRLGPLVALGAIFGVAVQVVDAFQKHWLGLAIRAVAALPLAALTLPVPWLAQPFSINSPSWSLFYEITANLLFAALATRLTNRWLAMLIMAASLSLAALVIVRHDIFVGWTWPTILSGSLRVAMPFLAGLGLRRLWSAGLLRGWAAPFWMLGAGLAVILLLPPLPQPFDQFYVIGCILLVFPAIIALGSGSRPNGLSLQVAAFSAELSFPLYILHYPLLVAFDLTRTGQPIHTRQAVLIETVAARVMAMAASKLFDIPAQRRLAALRDRKLAVANPEQVRVNS